MAYQNIYIKVLSAYLEETRLIVLWGVWSSLAVRTSGWVLADHKKLPMRAVRPAAKQQLPTGEQSAVLTDTSYFGKLSHQWNDI